MGSSWMCKGLSGGVWYFGFGLSAQELLLRDGDAYRVLDCDVVCRCSGFVDGSGAVLCDGDVFEDGKSGLWWVVRWVSSMNGFRFMRVGGLCLQESQWRRYSYPLSGMEMGRRCGVVRVVGSVFDIGSDLGCYSCRL